MQKISTILIDCQEDFLEGGSLPVDGGRQAVKNIANLVNRLDKKISNIYASLDSHQNMHVFTPNWWLDKNNRNPDPYTPITYQEVLDGEWRTSLRSLQKPTEEYLEELERRGRYTNVVWPLHCKINTSGWLLEKNLSEAFDKWEINNLRRINYIAKGNNPMTEFFSAFEAEVPQKKDNSTYLNTDLVSALEENDLLVFGGLAGSHCLKFSAKSIFDNFSNGEYLKKCVLLTDCTAPVTGYEQQQEDFINEYKALGMKVTTSKDFLA